MFERGGGEWGEWGEWNKIAKYGGEGFEREGGIKDVFFCCGGGGKKEQA